MVLSNTPGTLYNSLAQVSVVATVSFLVRHKAAPKEKIGGNCRPTTSLFSLHAKVVQLAVVSLETIPVYVHA